MIDTTRAVRRRARKPYGEQQLASWFVMQARSAARSPASEVPEIHACCRSFKRSTTSRVDGAPASMRGREFFSIAP